MTVEIARSPDEVWAYLTDVSNLPAWQSGVRAASIVGGGGPAPGARIEESRHLLGRELHTTLEISECDPPRLFCVRALDSPIPYSVRHELEPTAGGGTRLRVVGEGDAGLLPGFAVGLMARRAEKEFRRDFERLKTLLES